MNAALLSRSTRLLVNLEAFRRNIGCVRSYCGEGTRITAVVKANAYGHGMLDLSREAVRAGVDQLGVARITDALEIRRSGIAHSILVFENPPPSLVDSALAEGIDLSVSTAEAAAAVSSAASQRGGRARVHVKVDTGMTRLGFSAGQAPEEIVSILRLPRLELAAVYSHFATSDDPDTSFALSQIERFNQVLDRLRRLGVEPPVRHMANSGAIISLPESRYDMVRPGIMLYGCTPSRSMREKFPVTPVMSFLSTISMLRSVGKGTSVSYGRQYTTSGTTTIAAVPIGYGDGYTRLLSGRASVLIRGKRYPVVGAISMDHLMVDVGSNPGCQVGDDVTLIGKDGGDSISVRDIAEAIGTIPYEIMCLVSARVPRVFVG